MAKTQAERPMQKIGIEHYDKKQGKTIIKEYVPVNERVIAFRQEHPTWSIQTSIYEWKDGQVLMQARISDENGVVKATAYALEREDASFINKTSYIENCETSAIGRALGFLGVGVDTSIASFEEVANAMKNQEAPKKKAPQKRTTKKKVKLTTKAQRDAVSQAIKDKVVTLNEVQTMVKERGKTNFKDLTYEDGDDIVATIDFSRNALEVFGGEEVLDE